MIQVKHVYLLCLTLLRGDLNTDKLIMYHVCQCFSTCGNRKRRGRWKNWETVKTSHDETNWITNLFSSHYISNVTGILRSQENWFRSPTKWKFIWFVPLQTSFEAMNFILVLSVFPAYLKILYSESFSYKANCNWLLFFYEVCNRTICVNRK